MFPLMPISVLANNDIVNHLHLWQNKKLIQKHSIVFFLYPSFRKQYQIATMKSIQSILSNDVVALGTYNIITHEYFMFNSLLIECVYTCVF